MRKTGSLLRMTVMLAMVAVLAAGSAWAGPTDHYLDLMDFAIQQTRDDMPQITALAEKCADQLIETNTIGAYANPPWGVSETMGRAGGLIAMQWDLKPNQKGILLYFPTEKCEDLEKLLAGDDYVYAVCPREVLEKARDKDGKPYDLKKLAGILGGTMPDQGLYPDAKGVFSAPAYRMGQLVRVWAFTGELISACTRKGKMPMIWKSVVLPGAKEWNEPLQAKAKKGAAFHDDLTVKPVAAGVLANAYLDTVSRDAASLRKEAESFQKAGSMMAKALAAKHVVRVLVTGHAFPGLIESRPIYDMPSYFADYTKAVKPNLKEGDVQIVMPYRSVPMEAMADTFDKVSTIVGGPMLPEGIADKPNTVAFKIGWISGDALATVEGYPVKVLPESSFVQGAAYFCITAEMGLAEQELQKAPPTK